MYAICSHSFYRRARSGGAIREPAQKRVNDFRPTPGATTPPLRGGVVTCPAGGLAALGWYPVPRVFDSDYP